MVSTSLCEYVPHKLLPTFICIEGGKDGSQMEEGRSIQFNSVTYTREYTSTACIIYIPRNILVLPILYIYQGVY